MNSLRTFRSTHCTGLRQLVKRSFEPSFIQTICLDVDNLQISHSQSCLTTFQWRQTCRLIARLVSMLSAVCASVRIAGPCKWHTKCVGECSSLMHHQSDQSDLFGESPVVRILRPETFVYSISVHLRMLWRLERHSKNIVCDILRIPHLRISPFNEYSSYFECFSVAYRPIVRCG